MTDETAIPVPLDPLPDDPEDKRLWIGNLDPRITEFTLIKLLQKYGSIQKFDLLFHRSGPLEGQPRGYAFVTFATKDAAVRAMGKLNGQLIGSKHVCAKWAHNVSKSDCDKQKTVPDIPALAGAKISEKKLNTLTKIQAIEAKLKTMENSSSLDFSISDKPCTSTSIQHSITQPNKFSSQRDFKKHRQKPYDG